MERSRPFQRRSTMAMAASGATRAVPGRDNLKERQMAEATTSIGTQTITVTVNGERHTADVEPRTLLVHFLRDQLGLTGTDVGCDTSQCGACVVHLNGK